MKTIVITGNDISKAAEIIKYGGLVGIPTETVYGLASSGLSDAAVHKIYNVKGRPETKPISLLVTGMEDAEKYCRDIPEAAYRLAEKFWPGPLTIVLRKKENIPDIVTAGGDTVGIRCPDHPKTLGLIRFAGVPLAAPSANLSGEPSPKSADDVLRAFDGKIDAVIDGGVCAVGIESAVIDLTDDEPVLLRRGGLPAEEIESILGRKLKYLAD